MERPRLGKHIEINTYLVGAPLSGYISDRTVIRYRKLRGGVWYPEDRLRAALAGALILIPFSTVLYGFITTYVEGPIGVALDCFCLFINGIGVRLSLRELSWMLISINIFVDY